MREPDLKDEIERATLRLYRGRLICTLLRREGILAHNSHIVIDLAEMLLRTLAYRNPRS